MDSLLKTFLLNSTLYTPRGLKLGILTAPKPLVPDLKNFYEFDCVKAPRIDEPLVTQIEQNNKIRLAQKQMEQCTMSQRVEPIPCDKNYYYITKLKPEDYYFIPLPQPRKNKQT